MIIGISGKKQSGKDTVAKIIQGFDIWKKNLTLQTEYPLSNVFVRDYVLNRVSIYVSSWQVKKFASTLKEIVSILTGFKVEDLEKEEIKNTNLFLSYKLLNKKANTFEIFASMEDLVERLNHLRTVYLNTYSAEEVNDLFVQETVSVTPRLLLQTIGTDIVRTIHPNIWVNALMSEYKNKSTLISEVNYLGDSRCGICKKPTKDVSYFLCDEHIEKSKNNYPNWIITDLRFPNELEAVKKRGGITIRVNRPCDICGGSGYHKISCPVSKSGEHYSETALDKSEFDYIVDNDSDIESLIEKVKQILIKEKLL